MHAGQHITATIKLLRPLGQGGMGHVWVAEHTALGTAVAVKFMAPGYTENTTLSQRFTQEAQSAARLQNPHVAQVFDHGTTPDGEPYIVMELLSGETLRARMRRSGPILVDEVLRLVEQTATALDAAHKLGIVHRDIKPENLFLIDVGGKPFIKVLDLGIAKQIGADPRLTTTSATLGTPLYMSPEQFSDTKSVDHRADLWALGVVSYEALTGRPPFRGATAFALASAVQRGAFRPPSKARPELPRALDEWMAKALAGDVEARFGTAMDMAEALSAACKRISIAPPRAQDAIGYAPTERVSQEASNALRPGDADPAEQQGKQEPLKKGRQPIRRASPVRKRISSASAGPQEAILGYAPTERAPQEPPDARGPSHVDPAEQRGNWERPEDKKRPTYRAPPADESLLEIAHRPEHGSFSVACRGGSFCAIAFDERGSLIFLGSLSGKVFCIDLATRQLRWWRQLPASGLRLSSGGQSLAVGCGNGEIHIFDAARGDIKKILKGHEHGVRAVAIRRGGSLLATCGSDRRMALWRLTTGERLHTIEYRHFIDVEVVAFGGSTDLLASGGRDGTTRLWDMSLQPRGILERNRNIVRAVAFSPDDRFLAAGCDDGEVRLWKARTGELVKTLTVNKIPIISLTFDRFGGTVVAVLANGEIRTRHLLAGQAPRAFEANGTSISSAAVSPDGQYIASACRERGVVSVYSWPPSAGLP